MTTIYILGNLTAAFVTAGLLYGTLQLKRA